VDGDQPILPELGLELGISFTYPRGYCVIALHLAFDTEVRSAVRLSVQVQEDEDASISVSSKRCHLSEAT